MTKGRGKLLQSLFVSMADVPDLQRPKDETNYYNHYLMGIAGSLAWLL
jgi:hypothetical protein